MGNELIHEKGVSYGVLSGYDDLIVLGIFGYGGHLTMCLTPLHPLRKVVHHDHQVVVNGTETWEQSPAVRHGLRLAGLGPLL